MVRRRIYYVPGMISLIFLSILCVWYLSEQKKDEKSIVIFIPNSNPVSFIDTTNFYQTPFKTPRYQSFNGVKFMDFNLTGNTKIDSIKLDSFNFELQHILKNNEIAIGLHVVFGNEIKYHTFIKVLDICLSNCKKYSIQNYFSVCENELWFFYDRNLRNK